MTRKIFWIQALTVPVLFLLPCRMVAFAAASWEPVGQIETSARQEGELVIYAGQGQVSLDGRHAISKVMAGRYGISIDWTTTTSATDIVQRVLAEQRTHQHVADLAVTGFGTAYWKLKPKGHLLPILAPSTLQSNVWRLEPARLTPHDRDWLYTNMPLTPSLMLNTKLVRPKDGGYTGLS